MRRFSFALLLTVPALALVAGCGTNSATSTSTQPAPSATPVEVSEARYEALDAAVNERKGKVVLVDFWATWCGPCVKKFPHFVATHKKYADKGLACMTVSLDPIGKDEKYDKQAVLKFLNDKGATFTNYVLRGYGPDEEKIRQRFGLDGGIPFMVMFGKDGKRVWDSEQKQLSDAELDKLIETELAK